MVKNRPFDVQSLMRCHGDLLPFFTSFVLLTNLKVYFLNVGPTAQNRHAETMQMIG